MSSDSLPGQRSVTISNKRGLHARASAKFVTLAASFDARVRVIKDGIEALGTSILGLMMLAAAPGDTIEIAAEGPDADAALQALTNLVANKFDEE